MAKRSQAKMNTTDFFAYCNPEPEAGKLPEDQTGFTLQAPCDLPDEDKEVNILLLRDGSLIRYPFTRFLLAISDQTGKSPWELCHRLADVNQMCFENYWLPFHTGEVIWVTGKFKPVLRDSLISIDKFWALNPVVYEEVCQEFSEEIE